MTEIDNKNKHATYEKSAGRVQIISVRISKSDRIEEWEAIRDWLKALGDGDVKKGLYSLAISNKIIE